MPSSVCLSIVLGALHPSGKAALYNHFQVSQHVPWRNTVIVAHVKGLCACAQYGQSYYIAVSATNAAGLTGTVKSQAILIQHESQNLAPGKVAAVVIAAVLGTGIAVAAFTIWITSRRYCGCYCNGNPLNRSHKSRMQRKKLRSQNDQMKALMNGRMARKGDGGQQSMDQLVTAHELAFVMTDMEGSTSQASADPAAFEKIQQVHDMVRHPTQ